MIKTILNYMLPISLRQASHTKQYRSHVDAATNIEGFRVHLRPRRKLSPNWCIRSLQAQLQALQLFPEPRQELDLLRPV